VLHRQFQEISTMAPTQRRRLGLAALALVAAATSGGCAKTVDHQGYLADETLIGAIQPGVDNQESVGASLGRPTFTGQFDQRDWYYVSRRTRSLAFATPRPVDQTVLHVRFDDRGNVASVERTGLEKVVSIEPDRDKTPTLGRTQGFFQELFRGVSPGAVASAGN
jgi:outer membrane protein assembly factor BamE (lipoprotein component of BamABCDE complex)